MNAIWYGTWTFTVLWSEGTAPSINTLAYRPSCVLHPVLSPSLCLSIPPSLFIMGETDLSLQKNKHLLHQEDELQQDGSSPAGHPAEPPFTLKTLPGRGIGAVAKRMIPAGTLVLKEQATLTLQDPSTFYTGREYFQSLVSAYVNLPATSGQAILGLSAYTHPDDESTMRKHLASYSGNLKESQIDSICKLYSILTTNCFEGATSSLSSLYLKASRFNHSCLPNCTYTVASEDGVTSITVFSRQDVQSGEELTVPYLWIFHPREERQAKTLGIWGFVCGCPACDTTNPSVDTAAHEQRLEVYRRLERDSCLTMQMHACEVPLSMEDYDEALGRSIQRAEIVDSIGESDVLVREYVPLKSPS